MSSWNTISIGVDPLGTLLEPLKGLLKLLEAAEAILEALLEIIKAFNIDFGNPLRAIVALLLASIRAIINQIQSTGLAVLVVYPDFNRQDFASVIQSVSGSYPAFENKLVKKFYDTSDIFRPSYGPGSSVGMIVFYIGTDSPGDLITQIYALLKLINTPINTSFAPPTPINLTVNPARLSGDPVTNFKSLFDSDIQRSLVVEWQMPTAPSGSNNFGFINALVSFYNSFRFFNFIIERSEFPSGQDCLFEVNTQVSGKLISNSAKSFDFPSPVNQVPVVELNGDYYRNYEKKTFLDQTSVLSGYVSGSYRFVDEFEDDDSGKTYYYRVRSCFGKPDNYINTSDSSSVIENKKLVILKGNTPTLRFDNDTVVSSPSSTVRGYVPEPIRGVYEFNPYEALYDAVRVAILLNFEIPGPSSLNNPTPFEIIQRTGWGTLSSVSGQVSTLKSAFQDSQSLQKSPFFKTTCRRISNQSIGNLYENRQLMNIIRGQWNDGVQTTTIKVLFSNYIWKFPILGANYDQFDEQRISRYLSLELFYTAGQKNFAGPYPSSPINDLEFISEEERIKLKNFLQTALVSLSGSTDYLSWYSLSIGDLFPEFYAFMFDFEQFIKALLKALETSAQLIEDIIATLIIKIQQLEAIIESINALVTLFEINARASVLSYSSSNGSIDSLVQAITQSEDKPAETSFGLHSGIVLTAGGPGEGSIAAIRALEFILSLPF